MKKLYKSFLVVAGFAVLFSACDSSFDSLVNERLDENPLPVLEYSTGSADFSTFVSIGNSLTAGYMDGALYTGGQQRSMPAMMAAQFSAVAGEGFTFQQPDINSENGFNTVVENPAGTTILGRMKLYVDPDITDGDASGPSPTIYGETPTNYTGGQIHNFGVPGIQVGQLLTPATGGPNSDQNPAFNPFYARFASNPGTSTILGDAVAANPTFFSLWIGSNDVLGYAVSGASNEAIFTSVADFQTYYSGVINTLMSSTSAKGVVADIPFFLGMPLFQAVPYNPIPVSAQAQVDQLNAGYAQYNAGLQQAKAGGFITDAEAERRTISFVLGANAFVMEDETLTDLSAMGLPSYRQSEATDLVLMSAASSFPTGVGTQTAAGDELVLIPSEQAAIETRRQTFNGIIHQILANYSDRIAVYATSPFANPADPTSCTGGVFCDIFGLTDGVPGISAEGLNLTPDFRPSGVFSTDGVHPNPRGYAILANQFLETIEAKFGAILPSVSVTNQPSVVLCNGDCVIEQ